ncbi:MAG: Rieske 2Fe-2S domain-containing protein [Candidatus Sungbacteria bacterium]|uniref:Rieske 2Fe-2S domain-containing protein n=1 Tax=Candidatus Sungiibacteriota bacterium TaxID=2750080 RepID=A0A9D6LMF0_9BACT|nr:Rieske 2Fe-2S domain-containing protein [Candidatus Sungbacteria bacterium]
MRIACKVDDAGLNSRGWKVFDCFGGKTCLVIKEGEAYRGFVNTCPHMQGEVRPWDKTTGERVLQCKTHGAEFDYATGARLSGPPPEGSSLRALQFFVEQDVIYYK